MLTDVQLSDYLMLLIPKRQVLNLFLDLGDVFGFKTMHICSRTFRSVSESLYVPSSGSGPSMIDNVHIFFKKVRHQFSS